MRLVTFLHNGRQAVGIADEALSQVSPLPADFAPDMLTLIANYDRLKDGLDAAAGAPLPVAEIAATARIICNSGQHGMVCLGLAAGIPQVCLPQHLEQLYVARQAAAAGVARVIWPATAPAETIREALQHAWADSESRITARDLAHKLAPDFARDDGQVLRDALARWL